VGGQRHAPAIIGVTTHILAAPLRSVLFGSAVPVMLHIIGDTIRSETNYSQIKGWTGRQDSSHKDYGLSIHCHQHNAANKFTEGLCPTSRYLPLSTELCFADGFDLQQGCSISSLFIAIAEHVNPFVASLHEFRNSVATAFGLLNSQPLTVTPLTH
jgi:hypothetical protein